jgi:methyl-accepting chemotaxis protein
MGYGVEIMKIQRMSQLGAVAIGLLFVVAVALIGYNFNKIRIGGTLHTREQASAELLADSSPAVLYVADAHLVASRVLLGSTSAAKVEHNLKQQRANFEERQTFWENNKAIPDELHNIIVNKVAKTGDAYWNELEKRFLPALRAGDMASVRARGVISGVD